MIGLFCFVLASPFKAKLRLEAENAVLRHQLNVLRRRPHGRVRLTTHDRLFFTQLYRWFPAILNVLTIIRPETLMRWHRAGFRGYWRWKSRPGGGRPQIDTELRVLVRRMSVENGQGRNQENWASGNRDDRKGDEHDGREPEDDSEPSLGSLDGMTNQKALLAGSVLECCRPGHGARPCRIRHWRP